MAQLLRISRTCREFFGFQFHYPTMKLGRNSAKFLEARALGASVVGMAVISDDTCDDPGEWINWAPFFFASSMPSEDHRGWLGEPRTPDTKKVSLGGMSESGGGTSGSEGLAATAAENRLREKREHRKWVAANLTQSPKRGRRRVVGIGLFRPEGSAVLRISLHRAGTARAVRGNVRRLVAGRARLLRFSSCTSRRFWSRSLRRGQPAPSFSFFHLLSVLAVQFCPYYPIV